LVELFIKAIVDNYNYSFAQWQPQRIKSALKAINSDIAERFNYSDSESLLGSIINSSGEDITEYLVRHNYPVWTNHYSENEFAKTSDHLVITYCPPGTQGFDKCINSIRDYALRINADFILLNDRKQGSIYLEKFRVKRFAERYRRIIYVDYTITIKEDCPNLFEIVPANKVGVFDYSTLIDKSGPVFSQYTRKRMRMLKADSFSRFPALSQEIIDPLEFESATMDSWFDPGLIVCDSNHANIWNPITFPFSQLENDDTRWIEISMYRSGHEIFPIVSDYNYPILFNHGVNLTANHNTKIFRYEGLPVSNNIRYDWLDDNNIIGYKTKPSLTKTIKILSLGHTQDQFDSIQDRDYITKINLNELESNLGNTYAESRIYSIDFDQLFPQETQIVGLTTASWNRKYVGLNPIDELHNWNSLDHLDNNTIICANTESSSELIAGIMYALNISRDKIESFLSLIGLTSIEKHGIVSNQVISIRQNVKALFDFYKNNNVLNKIEYFVERYVENAPQEVTHGYLSELATFFWIANQNFILLPQEVRKLDWYW
jgi:hypothetical protein